MVYAEPGMSESILSKNNINWVGNRFVDKFNLYLISAVWTLKLKVSMLWITGLEVSITKVLSFDVENIFNCFGYNCSTNCKGLIFLELKSLKKIEESSSNHSLLQQTTFRPLIQIERVIYFWYFQGFVV